MSGYPPSIGQVRPYERTSARGTIYLLGHLGAARVVVLPGDPTEDGTLTWRLLVQARPDAAEQSLRAAADTAERAAPARPARRRRRAPHPALRHPAGISVALPSLHDPIGDLWPADGGTEGAP